MNTKYQIGIAITTCCLLVYAISRASETRLSEQVDRSGEQVVRASLAPRKAQSTTLLTREQFGGAALTNGSTFQLSSPNATVVMDWYAFSSGGGRQASASYDMTVTAGQTAAGDASSASYRMNAGFQQNQSTGCCVGTTGNVNMTGITDLSDLSALVSYLTGGGYVLPCQPEANINNAGIVDLSDLSSLVSYLTGGGYVLPTCL